MPSNNDSMRVAFSKYNELNDLFELRYSSVKKRYPCAIAALDMMIRQHITRPTIGRGSLRRWAENNCNTFFGRAYLKQALRWAFRKTASQLCRSDQPKVVIELARMPSLQKELKRSFRARGYRVDDKTKCFFSNLRISRKAVSVNGREVSEALYFAVENGIDDLLNSDLLLSKLEKRIEKNIDELGEYLKTDNVRLIVTQDAHSFNGRILALSAKNQKIPIVEFAHGYTQEHHLITVAPICSNAEIVWSDHLRKEIACVLNPEEEKKVFSFGFPRPKVSCATAGTRNEALILIDRVSHLNLDETEDYLNHISVVMSFFENRNLILTLRIHPGERDRETLQMLMARFGDSISQRSLQGDLCAAAIVIGSKSSVLVEASFNGIPSLQINELATAECEGALRVSFSSDGPLIDRYITEPYLATFSTLREFDFPAFEGFLYNLIRKDA